MGLSRCVREGTVLERHVCLPRCGQCVDMNASAAGSTLPVVCVGVNVAAVVETAVIAACVGRAAARADANDAAFGGVAQPQLQKIEFTLHTPYRGECGYTITTPVVGRVKFEGTRGCDGDAISRSAVVFSEKFNEQKPERLILKNPSPKYSHVQIFVLLPD